MINNVVLVSGVQQSDSVIHIHVSILFQILFPFRLLHNIEQSFLGDTVGPCWLSVPDDNFINYHSSYREYLSPAFLFFLYFSYI